MTTLTMNLQEFSEAILIKIYLVVDSQDLELMRMKGLAKMIFSSTLDQVYKMKLETLEGRGLTMITQV